MVARMANRKTSWQQKDITRAIKGATDAGMTVGACRVDRDGNLMVIAKGEVPEASGDSINKMLGLD